MTSGDGGLFPAGLPVGEVSAINGKDITVKPFAPMESSLFVQVMNTGYGHVKDDILIEQSGLTGSDPQTE